VITKFLIAQTVEIEPHATKELSQELNDLKTSFQEEVDSVLEEMVNLIRLFYKKIISAFVVVSKIDILYAKILFSDKIGGIIPIVGNNGTISCYDAKHPLLLLKEKYVDLSRGQKVSRQSIVGNDIELNENSSTLIISGPNAGGKTVVLKTCGVLGLMVKYGIPIPARNGSRFDAFDYIMADIGDSQSVTDEISSYSGHLMACRDIIHVVREMQKRNRLLIDNLSSVNQTITESKCSLVLVDEIGRGTDPAHGSVLAESIIDDLSSARARMILSTHYPRIKELGFLKHQIGGMEFMDNKPTFHLKSGYISDSYPLELAESLGFPSNILEKATGLLEDNERNTVELQEKMRKQSSHLLSLERELKKKLIELEEEKQETAELTASLKTQLQKLRSVKRREFYQDITDMEQDLVSLVNQANDCVMKLQQEAQPRKRKGKRSFTAVTEKKNTTLLSITEIYHRFQEVKQKTKLEIIQSGLEEFKAVPFKNTQGSENSSCFVILEPGVYYGCRGRILQNTMDDRTHIVNLHLDNGGTVLTDIDFVAKCNSDANSMVSVKFSIPPNRRTFNVDEKIVGLPAETTENYPPADLYLDRSSTEDSSMERIENVLMDASTQSVSVYHGKNHPLKTWLRSWLLYHPAVESVTKGEPLDGLGDNLTILTLNAQRKQNSTKENR
jgi:dsDNA-specific endonuclease/ATPase MutS2